jgi:hypothetical protein
MTAPRKIATLGLANSRCSSERRTTFGSLIANHLDARRPAFKLRAKAPRAGLSRHNALLVGAGVVVIHEVLGRFLVVMRCVEMMAMGQVRVMCALFMLALREMFRCQFVVLRCVFKVFGSVMVMVCCGMFFGHLNSPDVGATSLCV